MNIQIPFCWVQDGLHITSLLLEIIFVLVVSYNVLLQVLFAYIFSN